MNHFFTPKRETWLYTLNPAWKFVIFMASLMVVLFTQQVDYAFYQMIANLLLLFMFNGYSCKKIVLLTAPFILIFVSSASTLILFGRGEVIWWQWGLIKISSESFYHGLLVGFKTLSFGALGLLFALTTKPILFFYALMQQFKFPAKYAYSFIASIRILPMVIEDFQHRSYALKIRGMRYKKGIRGWYQRLQAYAVPLLAQSIRRAQRVAVAMEAKRFHMEATRTYFYPTSLSRYDILFTFIMLAIIAIIYVISDQIPIFLRNDF